MTKLLTSTAVLLALVAPAVAADEPDFSNIVCAKVNKTSDGFLAVRTQPNSNSTMRTKVLSGWDIVLDNRFTTGDWIKARSVYKIVGDEPTNERQLNGWVHRKYLKI